MKCQNLFSGKNKKKYIFQNVVCWKFTQNAKHLTQMYTVPESCNMKNARTSCQHSTVPCFYIRLYNSVASLMYKTQVRHVFVFRAASFLHENICSQTICYEYALESPRRSMNIRNYIFMVKWDMSIWISHGHNKVCLVILAKASNTFIPGFFNWALLPLNLDIPIVANTGVSENKNNRAQLFKASLA